MEDSQAFLYTSLVVLVVAYVIRWRTNPLNCIPTVGGPSAPILSYISALNFFRNGKQLMYDGYQTFYGSAFKVALFDRWMVVVSGPKMVEELRKRPDDELSFIEAAEEALQTRFALGREPLDDPYHVDIIREKLMRTLPVVLPDVIDELRAAVPDYIPTNGDEWTSVKVFTTMQNIVARTSNRVFVGLPVCRVQKYLDLAITFTMSIVKDRAVIHFIPGSMKPLIGSYLSSTKRCVRRTLPFLKPLLEQRMAKMEEFGDSWHDRPNDMLQWVLEQAIPRNSSMQAIVERILLVNFAAIHTTSNTVTHALFDLAAYPDIIQPLRDEIEPIIAADGWTKAAMGKMWKLDSFMKESQRSNGIGIASMTRKAMKDITLNDGTVLPKGTLVCAAAHAIHTDETIYADPHVFDPFRFSRMREAEGEGTKHQFVNTNVEYIPFGHGKHACPGRFFAANELKAILAFIIVRYDLKLDGDTARPPNLQFGFSVVPNPSGKVMFKKRPVSV